MCKEADEAPAPNQETAKDSNDRMKQEFPEGLPVIVTKGLPEPPQPVQIPEQAVIPPQRPAKLDHTKPTIANEEIFHDQDLSAVSM